MAIYSLEYGLKFSDEDLEDVEKLASIGYNDVKMAMFFDLPYKEFRKEFNKKDSLLRHHFNVGLTKSDAEVGFKLEANAKTGNITAIQQLEKLRKKQKVELIKNQIYFSAELD